MRHEAAHNGCLYQFRLRRNDKRGHGSAVSLPRLIVGRRHCRVLISGYINSDATGFDMRCGEAHPTVNC